MSTWIASAFDSWWAAHRLEFMCSGLFLGAILVIAFINFVVFKDKL